MNFERIPLSHHPHGFAIMVALQVALAIVLLLIMRRRGMI
jgi:Mg2+ and Co2+ transporter CorA